VRLRPGLTDMRAEAAGPAPKGRSSQDHRAAAKPLDSASVEPSGAGGPERRAT
jgi:hypothetical protein